MVKKRLIGVITVKNSIAVQSFAYSNYLPIGTPEVLIENLERWGVDEIIILSIDRSTSSAGPDFELISRISSAGFSTPISYGGGIHSLEDAVSVIQSGSERVVLDSLLNKNINEVVRIAEAIGSQAVIASLPLEIKDNTLLHHNYLDNFSSEISNEIINLIDSRIISEVMIIDYLNEGLKNTFQQSLVKFFSANCNLIVFGGISTNKQVKELMKIDSVVAVAIGNFLNYQEHSVDLFKKNLKGSIVRS